MAEAEVRVRARNQVVVSGVALEEEHRGSGPPLVFLHGEDGLLFSADLLGALGEQFEVRAPELPGWGGLDRPAHLHTVEDLSYVVLDYLEATVRTPVTLVGASFGAWVAASAAVKNTALISALVLVAPVGIKVGDRETRDFVDLYAIPRHEALAATYGAGPRPDLAALGPEDFVYLAQAQEAMVRYGFLPYRHDPALIHRLHRIGVPTLVLWGNDDQFVRDPGGYAAAYAEAIGPNASCRELAGGHRLEEQDPTGVAGAVAALLGPSPVDAPVAAGAGR
jgi:pimeloyl-ACP methyl ester carboxylesterase